MKVVNQTKNSELANNVKMADTFLSRMIGLLKHKELKQGEGLVITRCNSIHMFFMKFAIDVVFVDKEDLVVGVVENIKPFSLSRIYWGAVKAIELPVGVIQYSKTQKGDRIQILN